MNAVLECLWQHTLTDSTVESAVLPLCIRVRTDLSNSKAKERERSDITIIL